MLAQVAALDVEASRKELLRRVQGVRLILAWLAGFAGETWQQRWLASGADAAGKTWTNLPDVEGLSTDAKKIRAQFTGAAGRLVLLDVIRPSYTWLFR